MIFPRNWASESEEHVDFGSNQVSVKQERGNTKQKSFFHTLVQKNNVEVKEMIKYWREEIEYGPHLFPPPV